MQKPDDFIAWFDDLDRDDVPRVGGKNASLGEMRSRLGERGVRVPAGFAFTAGAYRAFLDHNDLAGPLRERLERFREDGDLEAAGRDVRRLFEDAAWPEEVAGAARQAYRSLAGDEENPAVAVRSSATAEDLPEASFAGQQDTFLHVKGEQAVLDAARKCYASLFTDRAIAYREEHGFDHEKVALSAGVQRMVRAGQGGSGVLFTLDTDTGFPRTVVINAAWGLGENVVQGTVDPDEYRVFKPLLGRDGLVPIVEKKRGGKALRMVYDEEGSTRNEDTPEELARSLVLEDEAVLTLARWAVAIEDHYGRPMDVEWARDGVTGELFVLQARPETVQSRKDAALLTTWTRDEEAEPRVSGLAVGDAVASGTIRVLDEPAAGGSFEDGDVLVTELTDPDWLPVMKRAAAVVTDRGGRTSHAAIVSRELGVPAVIGSGNATSVLGSGDEVTVSCAEGETGRVYGGEVSFTRQEVRLDELPEPGVRLLVNVASPGAAWRSWRLPVQGVGLARLEFIVGQHIGVHPLALARFDEVEDEETRARIKEMTRGSADKEEYFVERLARGTAAIAASRHPDPVIVRLSDFKTNEYARLLGGRAFEPDEENPMLGWRGASRYYHEDYRDGFALECRGIARARETIGLDNIVVMVPFCRTPEEADAALEAMARNGLARGENGLKVYMMVEVPSNVVLADRFASRFDGFSIGSNDLTQLVLGVDRDSDRLGGLFDERNEAVRRTISDLLASAREQSVPVGICGQAPSDYPDFAAFLVEQGIDSISLNPDSVLDVIQRLGEAG